MSHAGDNERTYRVEGMTCGHCVAAVQGAVQQVPGAESVRVDLAGGLVAVRGAGFDDDAVRAAVLEAGYSVA